MWRDVRRSGIVRVAGFSTVGRLALQRGVTSTKAFVLGLGLEEKNAAGGMAEA
jgi:hypothetical protein